MGELELQASLERRSRFLTALLKGWVALHLFALIIMVLPPLAQWDQFLIIGISLTLSLGIGLLNKRGHIYLAGLLFCLVTNAILILAFIVSLASENTPVVTAMLGSLLSLGILFSGMLIRPRAIFWFTGLNVLAVLIPFLIKSQTVAEGIGEGFPIIAFLLLVALTSWLYQRTLNQALNSLTAARQAAENVKVLQREVEIAHNLQQQLYPPPPQYGERICFAARCEPAHETGGDFYDFLKLDNEHLGIVVADVSGKSISAAIVMAMTRSIIRYGAQLTLSPAEVLEQTNRTAIRDVSIDQMITVFYGVLNTQTLQMVYANAGHPYPILKRNGSIDLLDVPGFPIRTFPEAHYQDHTLQLKPGDQLVWISDGIVEAHNAQNQLFGFEQLEQIIYGANHHNPEGLLDHIWQAVHNHRGEAIQTDDITLVVANFGLASQPT